MIEVLLVAAGAVGGGLLTWAWLTWDDDDRGGWDS